MSAIDFVAEARRHLDVLAELLREAAERNLPAAEILEEALPHLENAQEILGALGDDEGTE